MQWFNWGKQSNIFGLPIGFALVIESLVNLYRLTELRYLLNKDWIYLVFHDFGTVWSESVGDPARMYMLSKMILGVLWGLLTLLNIALLGKAVWLAITTFVLACLFYALLTFGILYGVFFYFHGDFLEFKPALSAVHFYSPFPWPAHFWISLVVTIVVSFLLSNIAIDAHLSFMKILQHGGTGWENKAYFQIIPPAEDAERNPLTRH